MPRQSGRFRPQHPRLAALGSSVALALADRHFSRKDIHRDCGPFAAQKKRELREKLDRGETVYLAGMALGGSHNSGVSLVEVDPASGPRLLFNLEEERYSGRKHANHYPDDSLAAMLEMMAERGLRPKDVHAYLGTFDVILGVGSGIGTILEEFPWSIQLLYQRPNPGFSKTNFKKALTSPQLLAELFGSERVPMIGVPHHANHAYFSYMVSPFANHPDPTMVLVLDGGGDVASVSHYLGVSGELTELRNNRSLFDSLGTYYSIISSTQGGWTILSSEGRYMGAAAYGDLDRATNPYYAKLRDIFRFEPNGDISLNRELANWPRAMMRTPYTPKLVEILGPPLPEDRMWNPDAVLRLEDLQHYPATQERLDKAAATQMVLEDAVIHMVDGFIRETGSDRLVLTGGTALNAVANMRVLEHFDEDYYERTLGRRTRLHLWVPPVPNDAGVPPGAAYAFAGSAGVRPGAPLKHAFYCGRGPRHAELVRALHAADDLEWRTIGSAATPSGIAAVADLMASITAANGIIGLVQGPAETGPRALGHRSVLANPTNPNTRDLINERVKHREPIRPLAPMMTLRAALDLFELSEGASDDDYNAYNYMVITARAKPHARAKVPAVIHADGTARLQIVRADTDPVTHAYLEALGRRIGVEVAVNTSFNVGAPIAQTVEQALDTLRRAKGMDGVFLIAEDGTVAVVWERRAKTGETGRIRGWIEAWQREMGASEVA